MVVFWDEETMELLAKITKESGKGNFAMKWHFKELKKKLVGMVYVLGFPAELFRPGKSREVLEKYI